MATRFFIKRSTTQSDPGTALGAGELAYTYSNKKLWIGHPDGEGNLAQVVELTESQPDLNEIAITAIAKHEADADPHPQYLNTMSTAADIGADSAGTAVGILETHLEATNPHPQYLTEAPTLVKLGGEPLGTALGLLQQHLAANDPHQTKAIDADYEPELNSVITGKNSQRAIDQLAVFIADLQTQVRNITPSNKPPLIVNNFVNADGKKLSEHFPSTYQGIAWIEPVGQFKHYGNRVRGDGTAQARAYIETTASTGIVINAIVILRQVAQPQGVICRVNASNGHHIRIVYTSNKFELLEVGATASSKTNLLESIAFNQAYRFRVLLEGAKITLLVNGVQKLTWTTTFNQAETRHGIYASSSTTTEFEDFEVTPL